ncbi:RNA polymerase sigma factor [Chondromyces apiculatus]|uniref:RNA polymerase sigma factor RpoE n=1 Tax=Chondromyces apiculatus DSM 436 TaxID=1192034 RepID=A0A017T0E3_9BACT|nr:RNA polymerase sigma factor [Chondromyces apiculatus]EYF02714.1 RNA polymerase sigma factor RpoE [Chondromyces apiculatus DSM 436]
MSVLPFPRTNLAFALADDHGAPGGAQDPDDTCVAADPGPEVDGAWAASTTSTSAASAARLRAMVDQHFDAVWRSLRRLGAAPADLDDCAQQVFMIASRRIDTIQEGSERAFLLRTAVNVAAHAARTQRRRREVPSEEEQGLPPRTDPSPAPDEIVEHRRQLALLDALLATLPDDLRVVLVLFELEELSTQEIAAMLAIPMGTVASRLRRAREAFSRAAARKVQRPQGGQS